LAAGLLLAEGCDALVCCADAPEPNEGEEQNQEGQTSSEFGFHHLSPERYSAVKFKCLAKILCLFLYLEK